MGNCGLETDERLVNTALESPLDEFAEEALCGADARTRRECDVGLTVEPSSDFPMVVYRSQVQDHSIEKKTMAGMTAMDIPMRVRQN